MKRIFASIVIVIACIVVFEPVFAAVPAAQAAVTIPSQYLPQGLPTITGNKPTEADNKLTTDAIRNSITQRIVSVLVGVAGVVAIYFIVTNGWWLIASAGNEEQVTERKKGLMWAIVGLVLVILSYSIIRFIISIPFQADQGPDQGGPEINGGQNSTKEPVEKEATPPVDDGKTVDEMLQSEAEQSAKEDAAARDAKIYENNQNIDRNIPPYDTTGVSTNVPVRDDGGFIDKTIGGGN